MKPSVIIVPLYFAWASSAAAHGGQVLHTDTAPHIHAEHVALIVIAASVAFFALRKLKKTLVKARK